MTKEEQCDEMIEELEEALTESEKTTEYFMNKCRELEVNQKELPEYDQDEAVEFIEDKLLEHDYHTVDRLFIHQVLDADEEYMRSKGIIYD